jgi:hypothetical protein
MVRPSRTGDHQLNDFDYNLIEMDAGIWHRARIVLSSTLDKFDSNGPGPELK